jgi:cytochrome c556
MKWACWLSVLALGVAACASPGEERASDPRTPVQLTAEQRNAVLAEMRTLLGSISGVLNGVARSDGAAIRDAALPSGMAEAADPALEKLLPAGWLELAGRTHKGFDDLAEGAKRGPEGAVARLAGVTEACVTCHARYRLAAQ